MKIALFSNNYFPNPYGVTRSIESFREQLEKDGHTVYIFAPRSKGFVDKNPNVFRYPSFDLKYKISYPLAIPFSWKIDRILKKLDLDIIHSQHPSLLGSAAARWAKRKKIPLVFTWHTLYDRYAHFVPLLPQKFSAQWIIRKAVKYANRSNLVVTPTESVIEIIRNWGVTNQNVRAIPSGVEEKNFAAPDQKSVRNKYHIQDDELLLFSVCRLTAEKNTRFLFQSVFQILKKYPRSKFLVVSGGDLQKDLESEAEKAGLSGRVIFAGVIERKDIKNFYAAGDIFVYASLSETQGMVVSEAMYSGLPVVAVRATGISDLVENNRTGVLTAENQKEFVSAVSRLIEDPELRIFLSKNARKFALENLTAEKSAEKLLAVYRSLLKQK